MTRAALGSSLLVLAGTHSVSAASVTSIGARTGAVSATFTYAGSFPQSRSPQLTIRDAGRVVYRAAVTSRWCARSCWPEQFNPGTSALHVVDLENNGHVDVVLDLYSGGAHCCSIEQVFSSSTSTSHYVMTERNFGDPGARLTRLGAAHRYYFVSADDAFAYAFTDFAASGLPVQVLEFTQHSFVDVTRRFPALVEADAVSWMRAYRGEAASHYPDSVGVIAAWAADEDRLGHAASVQALLNREAAAGHLNSALSPTEPSGRHFVAALNAMLRRHGYLP